MTDTSDGDLLAAYMESGGEASEGAAEVVERMLRRCAEDLVTASVVIESVAPASPRVRRLQRLAGEVEALLGRE